MKSAQCQVSFCSRCRFYNPEGRRGGLCSQLGVPVESHWTSCALAMPVFAASQVDLEPLNLLPQPIDLDFAEVTFDTALLEAALEAPSASRYEEQTVSTESASARLYR